MDWADKLVFTSCATTLFTITDYLYWSGRELVDPSVRINGTKKYSLQFIYYSLAFVSCSLGVYIIHKIF